MREQALQVRHAAPAPHQTEVQIAGVAGQGDVQRLAVQRDGQRIVAVEPRSP